MKQPLDRLGFMPRRTARWGFAIGLLTLVGATACADSGQPQRPGRILIIRGVFTVFSLGMDELACRLTELGYRVDLAPPSMASMLAKQIQDEYLRDPSTGPLVIIGHSMGGRYCCSIPWKWRERGIPVRLVVILDSNSQTPVPDNVQRCVNLYVTNDLGVFHGQAVWSVNARSDLVNTDVTRLARPPGVPAVDHFTIDDSDWIRGMVVREVECALNKDQEPELSSRDLLNRPLSTSRPIRKIPHQQAASSRTSRAGQ